LTPGVPLDGRADLYAVGVMLYNMLTGTIPRGAFRMPSITLQTDARFDKIIGKAMEMDRERRYQTALDLRRDLDVILTTPAAKAGGQTLPAQAALPQKPMGKSPSAPGPKPVTKPQPPAQQATKPAAGKAAPAPEKPKSKAPLFIGIGAGAVIGAGAFFMTSGKNNVPSPPVVAAAPAAPAVPVKVREEPKPESKPAASKPKPAPKPAAPARIVAAAASWPISNETKEADHLIFLHSFEYSQSQSSIVEKQRSGKS
jgi:serine/threonine-protein kinase PpkA